MTTGWSATPVGDALLRRNPQGTGQLHMLPENGKDAIIRFRKEKES